MRYYIQRHSHRIAKAFLVVISLMALALGVRYLLLNRGEIGKVEENHSPTTESDNSPDIVSSRILSVGNIAWGRSLSTTSDASNLKTAYPFSGLSSLSRNEYDAWMANLACSLTEKTGSTPESTCSSSYLTEARKWFNILALGNGYTNDTSSVSSAQQLLKNAGFQFVGNQDMAKVDQLCKIIVLPARSKLGDGSYKVAQLPLVLCSINASQGIPDKDQFEEVARLSERLPVWVYAYMGDSNVIGQNELQKSIYRSFIDVGADMVIGNHPYAVQGAESYKGKLILYSLGNFIYQGGDADKELRQSVSLKSVISVKADQNVLSWMSLMKSCAADSKICLSDAQTQRLQKPQYSYELSLVTSDSIENGVTTKTDTNWEEQAAKRLSWEAVLSALSYNKIK